MHLFVVTSRVEEKGVNERNSINIYLYIYANIGSHCDYVRKLLLIFLQITEL
jgi:hypothetical protein